MSPSTAGQKSFKLHDRARHVLTETLRVDAFRSTCESATSSEAALTVRICFYKHVFLFFFFFSVLVLTVIFNYGLGTW